MNLTREFRALAFTSTFLIFFSSFGFCEANSKTPRKIKITYDFDTIIKPAFEWPGLDKSSREASTIE
ncbi:MAG: hypothetical protein PVH61_12460 [Candidatus Aminicenantes bacterium]